VQAAVPSMREQAAQIEQAIDYGFFYDQETGQMRGGFWPEPPRSTAHHGGFTHYTYGVINTETRIAGYLAIARGQVPPQHYYRLWRTPAPDDPLPQRAYPGGMWLRYIGVDVFEGHYRYAGVRVVPSWGGSLFEALMPALFVPEEQWGPRSWGRNHPLYVYTHMAHGLQEAGYGFWGFSPSLRPGLETHPKYTEYGLDAVGIFPAGYTSNDDGVRADSGFVRPLPDSAQAFSSPGERPAHPSPLTDDPPLSPRKGRAGISRAARPGSGGQVARFRNGVVAPYASFLALDFAPAAALYNLRSLEAGYNVLGPWGFWDSINLTTGQAAGGVLALDQGMIMAAICNALCGDILQHYFSDGEIESALRPLMAMEEFTSGADEDFEAGM
jgi:hypothetical protein